MKGMIDRCRKMEERKYEGRQEDRRGRIEGARKRKTVGGKQVEGIGKEEEGCN